MAQTPGAFAERQAIKSLYGIAKTRVMKWFENSIVKELTAKPVLRALVAQEILAIIAAQDESTSAETVRKLANGLWDALNTDKELN